MLKILGTLTIFFCSTVLFAQPWKTVKIFKPYKWMIGVNWSAIDDNGHPIERIFDLGSSWNIAPFPSKIFVDRYFRYGWSAEISATYGILKSNRIINDTIGIRSDLYNIDISGKYSFYNAYAPRHRWIDPFFTFGGGYTYRPSANTAQHAPTVNLGFGLNFWIINNLGIQLHSTGKIGFTKHASYFQHSAGIVYRTTDKTRTNGYFGVRKNKWVHGKNKFKQKGGH